MKKTIMIDARVVLENVDHGIACYTYELITNLIKNHNNNSCIFLILINKNSCLSSLSLPEDFHYIYMKTKWSSLLGQFELLKVIFKYKPNLFHSPSFIVPLLSCVKLIATIHDMNHVALAQNYSLQQKIYYFLLALRLRKNSIVLTVSHFSKYEIIKYMKISPNKIYVNHNGLSSIFKPLNQYSENELKLVKEKYHLPEKFIFTVGNSKPHKNLEALLEAYCQSHCRIPIVILSNSYEKLNEIARKHAMLNSIIFLNKVEQQTDLAKIYALSELFVFPSLYEGFGFPPLEAAASGVPVLTSSVSSLPEIMEDCAFYFDPYSIQDMKIELNEVINKEENVKQNKIQAGLSLARKFNWETTTSEVVKVYFSI